MRVLASPLVAPKTISNLMAFPQRIDGEWLLHLLTESIYKSGLRSEGEMYRIDLVQSIKQHWH